MNLRKNPIIFIILLLASSLLTAQDNIWIKDENQLPIKNVFVFNQSKSFSNLTDSMGQMSSFKLDENDTLTFQHPAFIKKQIPFSQIIKNNYYVTLYYEIHAIPEFVFTSSRLGENKNTSLQRISIIDAPLIQEANQSTSADLLQNNGEVFVQKSQLGGGSPILRGFEANRILLVVDGVRMNNSIYRSGHLQNSITVDPNVLERMEVLFGPASVIYGSDALGGVIQFISKDVDFSSDNSLTTHLNSMVRFSSANNNFTYHFDYSIAKKKWASISSFTANEFGDLTMGSVRKHGYENFGRIKKYALRVDNKDTILVNPNSNIHVGSGYSQYDFLQKIKYKINPFSTLKLNVQLSTSSNIPRYDRLNDTDDEDNPKFAVWDYGPQNRLFSALEYNSTYKNALFDQSKVILSYQKVLESRITRKIFDDIETNREENLDVFSLNIDFGKTPNSKLKIDYGIEYSYNNVASTAYDLNIINNEKTSAATRYPDGGSKMNSTSAYLKIKNDWTSRLYSNAGLRANTIQYTSIFLDTQYVTLPITTLKLSHDALVGSVGLGVKVLKEWDFELIASSAYRVPNVDDYGKVFEKNGLITIPSTNIKPERTWNAEFGINGNPFNNKSKFRLSAYYSLIQDLIHLNTANFLGSDTILYDGAYGKVVRNENSETAIIYGASIYASVQLSSHFYVDGNGTFTYGQNTSLNAPLGHIPPIFSKAQLAYKTQRFDLGIAVHYFGEKLIGRYSPFGEDNEQEATPFGTPGYALFNFRSKFYINRFFTLQCSVENILDHHYKSFSSGISGPGRNFIVALRAKV